MSPISGLFLFHVSWWFNVDFFFFFSSRRRHTRSLCDWSSDVCSSDLVTLVGEPETHPGARERLGDGPGDRALVGDTEDDAGPAVEQTHPRDLKDSCEPSARLDRRQASRAILPSDDPEPREAAARRRQGVLRLAPELRRPARGGADGVGRLRLAPRVP